MCDFRPPESLFFSSSPKATPLRTVGSTCGESEENVHNGDTVTFGVVRGVSVDNSDS